jgi:uncharacterized protein (DUF3820 family)
MKSTKYQRWPVPFGKYLALPHEFLHIVGYRLVGKQCVYRWGDAHVTPLGPMTLWERLVGILLPFVVFSTLCLVSGVLSGLAYRYQLRDGSLGWFILLVGLALVFGSYAGTAIGDLRKAYLLLFDKPWHSWTPFDIFFWPVVNWTEVRKNVATKKKVNEQD